METIYNMLISKNIKDRILAVGLVKYLDGKEQIELHNKLINTYNQHYVHKQMVRQPIETGTQVWYIGLGFSKMSGVEYFTLQCK